MPGWESGDEAERLAAEDARRDAEREAAEEAERQANDAAARVAGDEINAAQQEQPGPTDPHLSDVVDAAVFDDVRREQDRLEAAKQRAAIDEHRYDDAPVGGALDMVSKAQLELEENEPGKRKFAPQVFVCRQGGKPITIDECMAFLELYSKRGIWNQCAYELGRSGKAFRDKAREDPVFAVMVGEAAQDWRERLQSEIIRRGYHGYLEPVFAGKEGDHVGYIRKFSDRLLQMEMEAAWPERYRPGHKAQADLNMGQTSGVMVVPGVAKSVEEWKNAIANRPKSLSLEKVTRPLNRPVKTA